MYICAFRTAFLHQKSTNSQIRQYTSTSIQPSKNNFFFLLKQSLKYYGQLCLLLSKDKDPFSSYFDYKKYSFENLIRPQPKLKTNKKLLQEKLYLYLYFGTPYNSLLAGSGSATSLYSFWLDPDQLRHETFWLDPDQQRYHIFLRKFGQQIWIYIHISEWGRTVQYMQYSYLPLYSCCSLSKTTSNGTA